MLSITSVRAWFRLSLCNCWGISTIWWKEHI